MLRPVFNHKSYTLATPPATEPVSLAEVKTFLRIDGTDDDAVLSILIASARRMAEEYTKRAFITQTWVLTMDSFADYEDVFTGGYAIAPTPSAVDGSQAIQLSRQPIQSITGIVTKDSANAPTNVATSVYTLDTASGCILLNDGSSWPSGLRERSGIAITFVAGWPDAGKVPEPIKQAILQHVAASYSTKVCADIPAGAKTLLDAFRLPESYGAF